MLGKAVRKNAAIKKEKEKFNFSEGFRALSTSALVWFGWRQSSAFGMKPETN
jgi:hypothetical protein